MKVCLVLLFLGGDADDRVSGSVSDIITAEEGCPWTNTPPSLLPLKVPTGPTLFNFYQFSRHALRETIPVLCADNCIMTVILHRRSLAYFVRDVHIIPHTTSHSAVATAPKLNKSLIAVVVVAVTIISGVCVDVCIRSLTHLHGRHPRIYILGPCKSEKEDYLPYTIRARETSAS